MTLSSLIYLSWAAVLVRRYNRKIKVYFSETSRYDLYWLRVLMISSAVIYTIIYLAFAIDLITPLAQFKWMHQTSFKIGAIYIVVLGFFGHRQGNLFSEKTIGIDLQEHGSVSEIKYSVTKKENDFILFLLKYMSENKPFLIPEITLSTLASELEVTPDYLSGIINNKLGTNLFDFINHYRIEEFKTRSMAPGNKKFTLLSIAYDCGFNSKATFNRVFKNVTGITPGEYAKR